MDKKPSWWQIMKIKVRLGKPFAAVENLGRADEVVVRYKNKFISILEDPDTGEIKSLGWYENPHMTHVNINDFWIAFAPTKSKGKKNV